MRPWILAALMLLGLSGCTTSRDYYDAVDRANLRATDLATAQARAETARIEALSRLAQDGDATARVAAAMALAFTGQGARMPQVAVPQQATGEALQWASVLTQPLTLGLTSYFSYRQGVRQIDASRDIALSTNDTMLGFGDLISTTGTGAYPWIGRDPLVLTPTPSAAPATLVDAEPTP
jgi:hypothetical protein